MINMKASPKVLTAIILVVLLTLGAYFYAEGIFVDTPEPGVNEIECNSVEECEKAIEENLDADERDNIEDLWCEGTTCHVEYMPEKVKGVTEK